MGKVDQFEIVAHRGAPGEAPENTIQAFQRAIDLGADAAELDVRLTSDHIPLVYHYYYLDAITKLSGPIFNYTAHQIQGNGFPAQGEFTISTLSEVLESFGSKTGFEIELKGPEKESSEIVGRILHDFKSLWGTIEVTSYEPVLLLEITRHCPGLATDLLVPQSPDWMKSGCVNPHGHPQGKAGRCQGSTLTPRSAFLPSGRSDQEARNRITLLGRK